MVECTQIKSCTILLAHDPLSSLAYTMITHTPLVAGNLPIKTLVTGQRPTNKDVIHISPLSHKYSLTTTSNDINKHGLHVHEQREREREREMIQRVSAIILQCIGSYTSAHIENQVFDLIPFTKVIYSILGQDTLVVLVVMLKHDAHCTTCS